MPHVVRSKYILGKHSVVGDSRRKWEDRVFADEIRRDNWDPLVVGMVADGVGSADFGSRGAQLTIDTVVHSLEFSQGNDIPRILEKAIEAANSAVYKENQEYDGDGLSTLVVAIVANDRVYIGNVGDSRAYWIQNNGRMLALTRDHSYYNFYGGDPNNEEAGILVNAIGKKESVQVDSGFYLMGDNQDQAYKFGMAGLPLKAGEAIVLCSDGLIKNAPHDGSRYVKDAEIVNALKTERMPDRAAIKMVSTAEGRRPDDNVSVVTIQNLSSEKFLWQIPRIKRIKLALPSIPKNRLIWMMVGLATSLFLLACICTVFWIIPGLYRIMTIVPTQSGEINLPPTVANVPSTFFPSPTPSLVIANVENVYGTGGSVRVSDGITFGQLISAFKGGGVKLAIPPSSPGGPFRTLYLFEDSSARININGKLKPLLARGAIYVQSGGSEGGEVYFNITENVFATVTGSRMILEIKGNDIWLYCFEGSCEYHTRSKITPVPSGYKMVYHLISDKLDLSSLAPMPYNEKWQWNLKCNHCMAGIVPTPTPKPIQSTDRSKPKNGLNVKGMPMPCP